MASTYSTNLALELIGTGDQAGTWGNTTNTNLGTLIEQAISGYVTQAVSTGTDTTITIPNGSTGVARNMYIELTGTGGTNTNLIVPANKKLYFIFNNSTGAVTVKVSGQTGVSVPAGKKMVLVSNGTDIVNAANYVADFGSNSATITQLTSTSATITNLTTTSLTLSNNPVLSGGTANGVLYLNGSKVATSGSALVFDGANLGLGVTPGTWLTYTALQIKNAAVAAIDNNQVVMSQNGLYTTGSVWKYINSNFASLYQQFSGEHRFFNAASGTASNTISFTQAMTLDSSGNLGIGTSSPGAKLDVVGVVRGTFNSATNAGTLGHGFEFRNSTTTTKALVGGYDSSKGAYIQAVNFGTAYENLILQPEGGNLGLGVTPSAWGSGRTALQIGGSTSSNFVGGLITTLKANTYNNGTNDIYIADGYSSQYVLINGTHTWYTATTGTAGNTITFGDPKMTLDASGNLGVGATGGAARIYAAVAASESNVDAFDVTNATNASFSVKLKTNVATINAGGTGNLVFANTASVTERARITSGGDFLIGSATTLNTKLLVEGQAAVGSAGAGGNGIYLYVNGGLSDNSYLSRASAGNGTTTWYIGNQSITTSSDERLKANIKPTERNALELLNQWEIVDHTWNDPSDQCENNRNSRGVWTGVVAQQVQPITPWLVNKPLEEVNEDGTINPWTMDFGYAVPLLVKAIQELKAELDAAKVKIAALESK